MYGRSVAVLAALAALAGCGPTGIYRSADPVAPGRWELSAAAGVGVLRDRQQDTRLPTSHLELEGRRGLTANLDLGIKLFYLPGVELNATWRVARQRWSFALAPSLAAMVTRDGGLITDALHASAGLAAIASRQVALRSTVSLGPLTGWGLYRPTTGGAAHGVWVGAFVNLDFRTSARWHFVPEVSVFDVAAGEVPVRGFGARMGMALRYDR